MKIFTKKFIILANIVLLMLPVNLLTFVNSTKAATDNEAITSNETDSGLGVISEDDPDGGDGSNPDATTPAPEAQLPSSVTSLTSWTDENFSTGANTPTGGFLWAAENVLTNPKLVFNPADLQDIRVLYCLGNVIPDYDNNPDTLATALNMQLSEVLSIKQGDADEYQNLLTTAQEQAKNKIVANLRNDVINFACIAGVDQTQAAEMLKYDKESVDAIINYANEKIIIDVRILKLLTNLVTPKDQGGAGHERIKVYRLRRNYTRDAKMFSRESDAIYQQLQEAESKSRENLNTISDVASADKEAVVANDEMNTVEAEAAIIDSYGRSQGDLVFSDTEDAANISAHWKGEAVDISEVDNIKCTLIKKRRLGGDIKTKLPETPIKLAWQTSEGYDSSKPPDYSSLNMNLKNLASGELSDILDEFDISADSATDLSDADFGDILGLIGKSMVGEIIGASEASLSGSSLIDTVKKVGALVLADRLDLPREAFLEANILNISDLEEKIGEAVLEEKLGLAYGSIRGNSLDEILTNIGRGATEAELSVPAGSLTNNMDRASMALSVGQRVIEENLNLATGSFTSASTYGALKSTLGDRKVDLVFSNPSDVDSRLGLTFGITASYIQGRGSPDDFARSVGLSTIGNLEKNYSGSSAIGNALRLAVNPANASPDTGVSATIYESIFVSGGDQTANYRSIGIERLSQALATNSAVRTALIKWLGESTYRDDCAIPSEIVVSGVTYSNNSLSTSTSGNVTLPEDQFMASYGLRRGDFFRLFGCKTVKTQAVYKQLGENALYSAVRNSTTSEAIQSEFVASHPELTSFLEDLSFYQTRLSTIKDSVSASNNDWKSLSSNDAAATAIKTNLADLSATLGAINPTSITSGAQIVNTARQTSVKIDNVIASSAGASSSSDQTLRDLANQTLADLAVAVQATDEILSGQSQSDILGLNVNQISADGSYGTNSSSTDDGTGISKSLLVLMLAGKISPSNFLISIGTNKVEQALDLPTNALLYYANFAGDSNREKSDGKNAFFRAIGQADVEETFSMPPYFFQGDAPATNATLTDVKKHVAKSYSISEAEAGAQIMRALDLPGEFSTIESNSISSISSVTLAAGQLDEQLGLNEGTTAEFLNGGALADGEMGNSEIRQIAGRLNISEAAIESFSRVLSGRQTLDQAKAVNYAERADYSLHNEFAQKPEALSGADVNNSDSNLANACPITFRYEKGAGVTFSVSNFIEDGSYVYTGNDGETKSFKSLNEVRAYAKSKDANYATTSFEFTDVIASGLSKNAGAGDTTAVKDKLNGFLTDNNKIAAFSDAEIASYASKTGVPTDSLKSLFTRENLRETTTNAGSKPIGPYLETVGRKTAESRILSALLGSVGITFAGLDIDATDIFDLLSGNGLQVAYRIGASYLSDQVGVSLADLLQVIEAPNLLLRQCSLANIGGNFLGSLLGLKTVSLSGNIYDNIGGAAIEEALGLPSGSFHGASIQELINNVGPVTFAKAFNMPAEKVVNQAFKSSENGEITVTNESSIDAAINTLDYASDSTEQQIADASAQVGKTAADYVGNVSWTTVDNPTSTDAYRQNQFLSRASSIDSQLGLSNGTTQQLLTGKITPDQYRRKVSDQVMTNQLPNILNTLGFDQWADVYKNYLNVASLISNIQNCSAASKCDRGTIFRQFSQLFGVNIDQQLGLPQGTLEILIRDPSKVEPMLMEIALTQLDDSLGLDSHGSGSFTQSYKHLNCGSTSLLSSSCWNAVANNVAGSFIQNFLGDAGLLGQPSINDNQWTKIVMTEDAQALVRGDLRYLQVMAATKAATALNLYGEGVTTPNLPIEYRVTYEDIRYAFLGSYGLENDLGEVAGKNYLTSINTVAKTEVATEASEMVTTAAYLYGGQCPVGTTAADCDPSITGGNFNYVTDSYNPNSPSQVNSIKNQFLATNSYDPAFDNPETLGGTIASLSDDQRQGYVSAKEAAKTQVHANLRSNLMYRMADAKLYQLDKNIPAGFTRTMLTGSGYQKTQMLGAYLGNIINNLEIFGVSLNDVQSVYQTATQLKVFIENPGSFDLDALMASGKLTELDNFITNKIGDVLGFDFEDGTFTAIVYGIKTGDFIGDHKVGNITVKGLDTIYSDWALGKITGFADSALGLPPGTAYQSYTMYRNLQIARNNADKAQVVALKAELITFIVTTVFAKQIAAAEQSLGLVPGTGGILVGIAVSLLLPGAAVSPVAIALFIIINLIGVYKVEVKCTADGYYPAIESPPDPSVSDNGNLGVFDGTNAEVRKTNYVAAAQYKAQVLAGDALMLSERTGDELAIPSQIMVGRQEDVDYWSYKVEDVICSKVGGCAGSNAGMWKNKQTTTYHHIGF